MKNIDPVEEQGKSTFCNTMCGGAPEDTLENESTVKDEEISPEKVENLEIDTLGKKLEVGDTTLSVEEINSKEEEAIDLKSLLCTLKLGGGAPEETPGNEIISEETPWNEIISENTRIKASPRSQKYRK